MTVRIDFSVGAGSGEGGSVQSGDSFWVDLPAELTSQNGTLPVYAPGTTTVLFNVTIADSPDHPGQKRATFVATDNYENQPATKGSTQWPVNFANREIDPGTYDLNFLTSTKSFADSVIVEHKYAGGSGYAPTQLGKFGTLGGGVAQNVPTWRIWGGEGPHQEEIIDDVAPTDMNDSALWQFDCSTVKVVQLLLSDTGHSVAFPSGDLDVSCTPEKLHVDAKNIAAGYALYLTYSGVVTDPRPQGHLAFNNKASVEYITDGAPFDAETNTVTLQQDFGSDATGYASPRNPTVTDAVCVATREASDPSVKLPTNGGGLVYSLNGTPAAGGTATVIATLQSGYLWANTLPDGWTWNDDGTSASFAITFADEPDCAKPATPVNPSVSQISCAAPGQTSGAASVTPADNTDAITYSVTGTQSPGGTATVVATLAVGYVLSDHLPAGWKAVTETTAEYAVVFDNPDCVVTATPKAPEVAQTVCVSPGQQSEPSLTAPADADGITYSVVGETVAGGKATVVATLDPGYRWASELPDGWAMTSDTTAEYAVVFDNPDCVVTATPKAPEVAQTVCVSPGQQSEPSLTAPADADGITYSVVGETVAGGKATVVATLDPGYRWASELPDGWAMTSETTAEYAVVFDNPDCVVTATLHDPTVTQAVCVTPGHLSLPEVSAAADSDGVSYKVVGTPVAGRSVAVVATLTSGYRFSDPIEEGWAVDATSASEARYSVALDSPACASVPVKPSDAPTSGAHAAGGDDDGTHTTGAHKTGGGIAQLAFTGSVIPFAAIALSGALVLLGVLLTVLAWRRRAAR